MWTNKKAKCAAGIAAACLLSLLGWWCASSTRPAVPPRTALRTRVPAAAPVASFPAASGRTAPDGGWRRKLIQRYARLPLGFEANRGQTAPQVKFLCRARGYTMFLTQSARLVVSVPQPPRTVGELHWVSLRGSTGRNPGTTDVLQLRPLGANPAPRVDGVEELFGKANYFVGNEPKRWRRDVPRFRKVRYRNLYPGIDLVFYGTQRLLEYDFVVRPGADPQVIRLAVDGACSVGPAENGDLVLQLRGCELRLRRPTAYQEIRGHRRRVSARFAVAPGRESVIRFQLGRYDSTRPLIIDPVLVYSTYLGGSVEDEARGLVVDEALNVYVVGTTKSMNFPLAGSSQAGRGGIEAFITKLDYGGTRLLYSTVLGGTGDDFGWTIDVDSQGNAYVAGDTYSSDFPLKNALPGQRTRPGPVAAFVTKLNSFGNALLYSTYLGGSGADGGGKGGSMGIAVNGEGEAYVTGTTNSQDFPTTDKAVQSHAGGTSEDAFVAKLSASGAELVFATYLGGTASDEGRSIGVDTSGNAYITGVTSSTDFPVSSGAEQSVLQGPTDAFVTKLAANGATLSYSRYLGGGLQDEAKDVAVDAVGAAYVTGFTSSADFPLRREFDAYLGAQGSFDDAYPDAFVTKLSPSGAVEYSTYLGGSGWDVGWGIAVDPRGHAFVTGGTERWASAPPPVPDPFPLRNELAGPAGTSRDGFLVKFDPTGSTLIYSTILGGTMTDEGIGVAADGKLGAYVAGYTDSLDFKPARGAPFDLYPTLSGGRDAFVTYIIDEPVRLEVKEPNGGERWAQGGTYTIRWISAGPVSATLQLELYKGGTLDSVIDSAAPNTGSYSWTIPAAQTLGTDYKIRVTDTTNPATTDDSDAPFTINAGALTVTSPNGGERFNRSITYPITWTSVGTVGTNVRIELYRSGAASSVIAASVPNSGSYSWKVPSDQALGSDYQVVITSVSDPLISDESDADFSVVSELIQVTVPNGGERWERGLDQTIHWTADPMIGTKVKIELYKAGALHTVLAESTDNVGSYVWSVPETLPTDTDYRIRVSDAARPELYDDSDSDFEIMETTLTLTSPNGGEQWAPGTSHEITWTYTGQPSAAVDLDLYAGTTLVSHIVKKTPLDERYIWFIPTDIEAGSHYKVKISSSSDPDLNDFSDSTFEITREAGALSGVVTSAVTNQPVGEVVVRVLDASGTALASTLTAATVTTEVVGGETIRYNYAFRAPDHALPAGTYTIEADGTSLGLRVVRKSATVTAGEETSGVDFLLGGPHSFAAGLNMFSLPYDFSTQDAATLLDIPLTNLKLAAWDTGRNNWALYPNPPANQFVIGRGYFALFDATTDLNQTGTPAPTSQPYPIPLQPGWNLIGAPFSFEVDWLASRVRTSSGVEMTLQDAQAGGIVGTGLFTLRSVLPNSSAFGGYSLTTRLTPFGGYWVYSQQYATLLVDSNQVRSRSPSRVVSLARLVGADGWAIPLVARAGEAEDAANYAGVSSRARDGRDPLDMADPPPVTFLPYVNLSFVPVGEHTPADRLAVDLRPPAGTTKTWSVEVVTNQEAVPVTLSWPDLSELPRTCRAWLIDRVSGERQSLRSRTSYTYRSGRAGTPRRLQLVVSSAPAAALRVSGLRQVPGRGPGGTVAFSLSLPAHVSVRVVTPAGRVVYQREVGELPAGLNRITWTGRDRSGKPASRGLYVVQVIASDTTTHSATRVLGTLRVR